MAKSETHPKLSPGRALRRFGFRQTLRGALIIGFLTGIIMGAQGAAYAEAYPDQKSRDLLVASLESAPALGFMAGEIATAASPASYSIYKSIALMTLLTSIWGLMTTTKLLRGQEEDGRFEQIAAGQTTLTKASVHMLIGFGYSFVLAFIVAWVCIAALGLDSKVGLSVGSAGLLTAGVFLPGVFFAGLGVLVSQLALTRGRALAYGLAPLLIFFTLRGAANSVSDWNDLKRYTPFGWTDLLNPVLGADAKWIIPTVLFTIIVVPLGLFLAKKRDLGGSIIPQSQYSKSRNILLGSHLQHSVRQNFSPFLWWTLGTLAYTGLLTALAKIGADIMAASPVATQIISKLGGTYDDLVIAFLGFGGLFTALILLVMTAVLMGNIRGQEAKGFLDNLLVRPVRRTTWLAGRLFIVAVSTTIIALLSGYLVWQVAVWQDVSLDLWILTQNAIALTGTIILLIGIGTLIYGILPRLMTIVLFAIIIWAFVVDVLKSFFSLGDFIDKTSLLHYVSFAPTKAPDWSVFAWLVGIGVTLSIIGVYFFAKRDITTE